jgi:hypothetical protein
MIGKVGRTAISEHISPEDLLQGKEESLNDIAGWQGCAFIIKLCRQDVSIR